MVIRYPPHPFAGETREQWERRALRPWRMAEKARLLAERGPMCERCGERAQDLDECCVTRGDMRGLNLGKRRLAFASCNLALLCARCNRESAHDRDGAWERNCGIYGKERMQEWYESLGLRAPRRAWLDDHASGAP
jgi:hypothetical protein